MKKILWTSLLFLSALFLYKEKNTSVYKLSHLDYSSIFYYQCSLFYQILVLDTIHQCSNSYDSTCRYKVLTSYCCINWKSNGYNSQCEDAIPPKEVVGQSPYGSQWNDGQCNECIFGEAFHSFIISSCQIIHAILIVLSSQSIAIIGVKHITPHHFHVL